MLLNTSKLLNVIIVDQLFVCLGFLLFQLLPILPDPLRAAVRFRYPIRRSHAARVAADDRADDYAPEWAETCGGGGPVDRLLVAQFLLYDQLRQDHAETFQAPITPHTYACSIQKLRECLVSVSLRGYVCTTFAQQARRTVPLTPH